jgi:hypothetical protein
MFVANAGLAARPAVTIANVPLPVTGSVNAAVSGTVSVSSLPAVSLTVPAQPFDGSINLIASGTAQAVGVAGQRLAVTTITISNFNATTQHLFHFNPLMDGSDCSGAVADGAQSQVTVLLEPFKTMQLQYPTPRIFELAGLGCIAAEVTTAMGGSVLVDVVGYAVP